MYSGIGSQTNMDNYHDEIVTSIYKMKKTLKICPDTNVHGSILLEINYVKDNGIKIRNLYINKSNLDKTLSKFIQNGFEIIDTCNNSSKISNISTTSFKALFRLFLFIFIQIR